jgi:hypothetical protein
MAKVGFYVSEAEKEWIKREGPGWFRRMLQMLIKQYPEGTPPEED